MSKQDKTKKPPYKPLPYREGNTVIKTYEVDFVDSVGNKAVITRCDFVDKKKNTHIGYDLRIKWLDPVLKYGGENRDSFLKSFWDADESYPYSYYDGPIIGFFKFKDELFMHYYWLSDRDSLSYMVFKMKNFSKEYYNELFESINRFEDYINMLIDQKLVEDFAVVKLSIYSDERIIEGGSARIHFNLLYEEHCHKKIPNNYLML